MATIKAPVKDEAGKNVTDADGNKVVVEQDFPLFSASLNELIDTLGEEYVVGAIHAKMLPSAQALALKMERDGLSQERRDQKAAEWKPRERVRRDPEEKLLDSLMSWPADKQEAFLKRLKAERKQRSASEQPADQAAA